MLLFVAKGSKVQIGSFWISHQEEFARQNDAQIEFFDSGHSIHQYEPEKMANLIRAFLSELQE